MTAAVSLALPDENIGAAWPREVVPVSAPPREPDAAGNERWWSTLPFLARRRVERFERRMSELRPGAATIDRAAVNRGAVRSIFGQLWDLAPFQSFLPAEPAAAADQTRLVLALLDAMAYHELGVALATALNGMLFLLPVATLAEPARAAEILDRFRGDRVTLGGMMMTEPSCGTDLLALRTVVARRAGNLRLSGLKHWAGFTGHADFWIVFARNAEASSSDRRGFFLAETHPGDPSFHVEEYYDARGLAPIPYGRTRIDATLRADAILGHGRRYPSVLAEILQRSRLAYAGLAHGFVRRALDRAELRAWTRRAFGRPLAEHDQVAARLERMRVAELLLRAMCLHVARENRSLLRLHPGARTESIIVKTTASALMCDAAEHLAVLRGAEGFRDGPGVADLVDAHPFRIFEGPNDVLLEQVARARPGGRASLRLGSLFQSLGFEARQRVLVRLLEERVQPCRQRERVVLGRVVGLLSALRWTCDAASAFTDAEHALARRVVEGDVLCLVTRLLGDEPPAPVRRLA